MAPCGISIKKSGETIIKDKKRGLSLYFWRLFFPSWQFFVRPGAYPVVQVLTETGEYIDLFNQLEFKFWHLFYNPQALLQLYIRSRIQRILLSESVSRSQVSREVFFLKALVSKIAVTSKNEISRGSHVEFCLVLREPMDGDGYKEVLVFNSKEYDSHA